MADITTTFITVDKLKQLTPVAGNVDETILTPAILRVHDMYILPLLGTALYEDIKTKIEADTTLASYSAYKTLIQSYLQITIAYYTLYEGLPEVWNRIRNVSVTQKSSGGSSPVSADEINHMRDHYKNIAEYYAQRAINYLIATADTSASGTLGLYWNPGTAFNTVIPKRSLYSTGLFLGETNDNFTRDEIEEMWEQLN